MSATCEACGQPIAKTETKKTGELGHLVALERFGPKDERTAARRRIKELLKTPSGDDAA